MKTQSTQLRQLMTTTHLVLALIASLAFAIDVQADLITPISQSRYVSASADAVDQFGTPSSDSDSDTATNFDRFLSSVSASTGGGSGRGSQDSNILASRILGNGTASSSASASLQSTSSGSGSSRLDVVFTIDRTLSYTYHGEADGEFEGSIPDFWGELLLSGPQGTLINESTGVQMDPVSISQSGKLFPGQYRIYADVDSSSGSGFGIGSEQSSVSFDFDLTLVDPLPVGVPSPANVPGKEYSHHADIDANANLAPMQNLAWDGTGNAWNSFRYPVPPPPGGGPPPSGINVDAIASHRDFLFDQLVHDDSALLVTIDEGALGSVQPVVADYESIYFQTAGVNSTAGVWAQGVIPGSPSTSEIHTAAVQASEIRDPRHDFAWLNPTGLEVWGPEVDEGTAVSAANATMFSTNADRLYGVSVFQYDPQLGTVAPYITQPQLVQAIAFAGSPEEAEFIDLDALMVNDLANDGEFGPGDSILFSIAPLFDQTGTRLIFDGGEIWQWNFDDGPTGAAFLNHGGIHWDTNNVVGAIFGTVDENIGGLESVPEPGSLLMLAVAALAVMRAQRRRAAG